MSKLSAEIFNGHKSSLLASVIFGALGLTSTLILFDNQAANALTLPVNIRTNFRGLKTNKCLDLFGGNTQNGAAIGLWDCHSGNNQKWWLTNENSTTTIRPWNNLNKCIDVPGGTNRNGIGLAIWDCKSSWLNQNFNQRWRFDNGRIRWDWGNTNKCIDVPGGNNNNGTRVLLWDCHSGDNQQWIRRTTSATRQAFSLSSTATFNNTASFEPQLSSESSTELFSNDEDLLTIDLDFGLEIDNEISMQDPDLTVEEQVKDTASVPEPSTIAGIVTAIAILLASNRSRCANQNLE